jgi:hypothetical protein
MFARLPHSKQELPFSNTTVISTALALRAAPSVAPTTSPSPTTTAKPSTRSTRRRSWLRARRRTRMQTCARARTTTKRCRRTACNLHSCCNPQPSKAAPASGNRMTRARPARRLASSANRTRRRRRTSVPPAQQTRAGAASVTRTSWPSARWSCRWPSG